MWASRDPPWSAKRKEVAAWTGSTMCVYSALSSEKEKSGNNKEKTQIGDSTTSREHSLFNNCNHHDFVRYTSGVLQILDTF